MAKAVLKVAFTLNFSRAEPLTHPRGFGSFFSDR
jgi:hypothetical protein